MQPETLLQEPIHPSPPPQHKTQSQHLVLGTALRELKANTTSGQLLVDLGVGIESVINTSLLLLIEDNLQDLAAIFLGAETLADNLDWVHEIGEDGIVNGSEGSGTWSLLSLRGTGAVGTLWAGKDTAGGEDEDVTVGELLLELTGETVGRVSWDSNEERWGRGRIIPLLDSVETLKGWDGDKDDNSLLAVANFNLESDQSQHAISNISMALSFERRPRKWSAARPIPQQLLCMVNAQILLLLLSHTDIQ